MTGKLLPPEVWARALRELMAYRNQRSPEKLAAKFHGQRLSGQDIRRIENQKDNTLGTDRGDQKLATLSGMLELPVQTLRLLYYGERTQLEALDFAAVENGAAVKQYLLEQLAAQPEKRRRSNG